MQRSICINISKKAMQTKKNIISNKGKANISNDICMKLIKLAEEKYMEIVAEEKQLPLNAWSGIKPTYQICFYKGYNY